MLGRLDRIMGRWDNHKLTKEFALNQLERNSVNLDYHKIFNAKDNTGYGRLTIRYKKYLAHRLSAWIFFDLSLRDEDTKVLHKVSCPYKNCWAKDCLYLGTQSENNKDAYASGNRDRFGLRNRMRKLS